MITRVWPGSSTSWLHADDHSWQRGHCVSSHRWSQAGQRPGSRGVPAVEAGAHPAVVPSRLPGAARGSESAMPAAGARGPPVRHVRSIGARDRSPARSAAGTRARPSWARSTRPSTSRASSAQSFAWTTIPDGRRLQDSPARAPRGEARTSTRSGYAAALGPKSWPCWVKDAPQLRHHRSATSKRRPASAGDRSTASSTPQAPPRPPDQQSGEPAGHKIESGPAARGAVRPGRRADRSCGSSPGCSIWAAPSPEASRAPTGLKTKAHGAMVSRLFNSQAAAARDGR